MKIFLLLILNIALFANLSENVHSSASVYAEGKDYTNSKQKDNGAVYGFGADIHHNNAEYKFAYEFGGANTKAPLKKDLKFQKLFLRYAYSFQNDVTLHLNYISVLNDNIALTDGGNIYGVGLAYAFDKKNNLDITQYYSNYKDFDTYQTDLEFNHKMRFKEFKIKLTGMLKYINISQSTQNKFSKYAKDYYLTPGFRAHIHYNSYHLGFGAFFSKRSFAIMNEGFKLQHHAMEFDRTYAIGLGKTFSDFIVRAQYIYLRATELPIQNKNVDINNLRIILNYNF